MVYPFSSPSIRCLPTAPFVSPVPVCVYTVPPCQAGDPSLIKDPKSLADVWLFKLLREAPTKAYVLIK